ncbi:hypothetical protein HIM_01979 [Hirsutella minnesotensis 3608]|nr:hypothetical protein HIM_01979 [Hirsutella minnesotensis 3608]
MVSRYIAYDVAAGGLLLLTAVAAVVVFLIALWTARRCKDAARKWILHFKIAFGLFVFAVVLSFFAQVLTIVYNELFRASFKARTTMTLSGVLRTQVEMDILGAFFAEFAVIWSLITLIGVAVGIDTARNGSESIVDKAKLVAVYVVALVLGVFNIVAFALNQRHFTKSYASGDITRQHKSVVVGAAEFSRSSWKTLQAARIVTIVMLAIQLAAGVAVAANSAFVAIKTRSLPKFKKNVILLLVGSALLLLRMAYDVGVYAQYVSLADAQWDEDTSAQPGPWFAIVDALIGDWSLFSFLVILFAMAVRKKNGFWMDDEPFMPENPSSQGITMQSPWGYAHSPQSQQPSNNSWQQPEQEVPGYYDVHHHVPAPQPTPQPATAPLQHDRSSPHDWQAAPPPRHQQPFHDISRASQPLYFSPPPPAHDETMGLYHQADGTPPQTAPLPYNEKP